MIVGKPVVTHPLKETGVLCQAGNALPAAAVFFASRLLQLAEALSLMPMARLPVLILFRPVLGCSRLAEFEAVAARLDGASAREREWEWDRTVHPFEGGDLGPHPVQILEGLPPSEHGWISAVAEGAVTASAAFEVLGAGHSPEECAASVALSDADLLRRIDGTWCFRFRNLGASLPAEEKAHGPRVEVFRDALSCLGRRKVELVSPDHEIWLLRTHLRRRDEEPLHPRPRYHLLLRLNARKGAVSVGPLVRALDVKRRPFLGPSAMPAERALMMANLALANRGGGECSVLDPFCGSGGLLLAAASLGARTVGGDLDASLLSSERRVQKIPPSPSRPMRGKEEVCIEDNFLSLRLPIPRRCLGGIDAWSSKAPGLYLEANGGERFDALLTDPPYGRRAFLHGAKGWTGNENSHVGDLVLCETLRRMAGLAAAILKPGGRLVFLMPVEGRRKMGRLTFRQLRERLEELEQAAGFTLLSIGRESVNESLDRATILMLNDV